MEKYDIIVVGAGPAGSTFVRELLRRRPQYRVLLINGETSQGAKACGGLLSPEAQEALARFRIVLPNDILANPQIFSVETIDLEKKLSRHYQRFYLNMNRQKFEDWLRSMIPEEVKVVNGQCISLVRTTGGQIQVQILENGQIQTYQADFLVGADGAKSIVRRTFFPQKSLHQYVSIQEWYPDIQDSQAVFHCIFDEKTSDSCSWMMNKDSYLIFGGAFPKEHCRDHFAEQKHRLEAYLGHSLPQAYKREACLVNSPRRARDFFCGEGNVLLLGEAAGFISASSFEGFSNAFLSAEALAEAFPCVGARRSDLGAVREGAGLGLFFTDSVIRIYRKNTWKLRCKLWLKTKKRSVLCSPFLRSCILRSGVSSLNVSPPTRRPVLSGLGHAPEPVRGAIREKERVSG